MGWLHHYPHILFDILCLFKRSCHGWLSMKASSKGLRFKLCLDSSILNPSLPVKSCLDYVSSNTQITLYAQTMLLFFFMQQESGVGKRRGVQARVIWLHILFFGSSVRKARSSRYASNTLRRIRRSSNGRAHLCWCSAISRSNEADVLQYMITSFQLSLKMFNRSSCSERYYRGNFIFFQYDEWNR